MFKLRRKLFSQNFIKDPKLAYKLVDNSSVSKNDLVLEIGPGKGALTDPLLKKSQHVVAVEIDKNFHDVIKDRFQDYYNFTLYLGDILCYKLPSVPYKVFSNIPFSVEGEIVRYLIDAKNPPEDCYLVVMKELAERLSGVHKDNLFSITHKPWFDFEICHYFSRYDFIPSPSVDAVLLRFSKKHSPLLSWNEKEKFSEFVKQGFKYGQAIYQNLKGVYKDDVLKNAVVKVAIGKKKKPTQVSLNQWIRLYKELTLSRV